MQLSDSYMNIGGEMVDFCELTKYFWKVYLSSEEGDTKETILEWLAPQCVIIGTGAHEFHLNRDEFIKTIKSEESERKNIRFQFDDVWCKQILLGDESCFVYGKIHIWWESDDKSVCIDMDSRFTFIYHRFDDGWKVVHVHQSLSNKEQSDGEYYPKNLIEKVQEYKARADEIAEMANKDALTGINNYRAFREQFNKRDTSGYLFILDIDKFKDVNDNYGHAMGNIVLIRMAEIMSLSVKDTDLVCRMGGDEFLIYCNGMNDRSEAVEFAQHIIQNINDGKAGKECWATVSIGGAYAPMNENLEEILERADKELYNAKRLHRGDCSVS